MESQLIKIKGCECEHFLWSEVYLLMASMPTNSGSLKLTGEHVQHCKKDIEFVMSCNSGLILI